MKDWKIIVVGLRGVLPHVKNIKMGRRRGGGGRKRKTEGEGNGGRVKDLHNAKKRKSVRRKYSQIFGRQERGKFNVWNRPPLVSRP